MRKITNQEYLVLKSMLGHSSFLKSCNLDRFLQSILVEDMDDGGMGAGPYEIPSSSHSRERNMSMRGKSVNDRVVIPG